MDKKPSLNKLKSKLSSVRKGSEPDNTTGASQAASGKRDVWTFLIKGKDFLSKFSYLWLILLFAFLTRLYGIGKIGVSGEEIKNIERIFRMDNPGEFLGSDVSTNLYYALQNIWGKIFGFSLANMRIFSILLSIAGLYIFYKFVEEWFNRKLAYIATFLMSISSYHILMSRNISHEVLYTVIVISGLYILTIAYRYKMWQYFVLAGAFLGLAFYTSETTFVFALLFIISGAYFYLKNKKFLTSFIKEKVLAIVTIIIVSLPFFYSLALNPGKLLSKFTYNIGTIFNNLKSILLSIFSSAPSSYMYTVDTNRIFDPFVVITFLLGLVYIILKIKRRKFYFLFAWFIAFFIIIILESTFSLGNLVYLVPIIFLLSARIQTYVLDKWFKTFPFNKFARVTMVLSIGLLFALSLTYNYRKVFLAWERYPDRKLSYNISPISLNLKSDKVYTYKTGVSNDAMGVIIKGELVKASKIEDIPDSKNVSVATSAEEYASIESMKKDIKWSEYRGKNLVILKGEKNE